MRQRREQAHRGSRVLAGAESAAAGGEGGCVTPNRILTYRRKRLSGFGDGSRPEVGLETVRTVGPIEKKVSWRVVLRGVNCAAALPD